MKKLIYFLLTASLYPNLTVNAQTWRAHNNGLPHGLQAKSVYGDGHAIIVANSSAFSGSQMYYSPDSSTALAASASTLGTAAMMETGVMKSHGVLFVGSGNGVYKSHDEGQTWELAGSTHGTVYSLYSVNDTLFAGFFVPKFSTDTGNTWTVLPGYTGSLVTAFFKKDNVLFVGSTSGLSYTPDFGTTWTSVTTPASMSGVAIAGIVDLGNNIYAGCNNGVYKSPDYGATWSNVNANSIFSLHTVDTSVFAGSAIHGIYQSSQDRTNWTLIDAGLPFTGVATYDAVNYISHSDDYLIASTEGDSAIYVANLGSLGVHPGTPSLGTAQPSTPKASIGVYPNPATDELNIKLNNTTGDHASITMYDVSGHLVKYTVNDGTSEIKIGLAGVAAGTYFVRVTTKSAQTVQKIVVLK